jgi:signal peptidase I
VSPAPIPPPPGPPPTTSWTPVARPEPAAPPSQPARTPPAAQSPQQQPHQPPHQPQPLPLSDDELSDTLAIDAVVDDHEAPSYDIPLAASPLPRPVSDSGRHRRPEPDLARLDAAAAGEPLPSAAGYETGAPGRAGDAAGGAAAADDSPSRRTRRATKREAKRRRKAPWWELPVLVLVAVLIAVLVKSFVVQPFYIPSASMEKTLHGSPEMGHDRILVNKPIYDLRDPHGGDIVVFHAPPGWDDEPASRPPSNPIVRAIRGFGQLVGFVPPDGLVLVKRVIATGGQGVKGDAQGDVFVSKNGLNGPWDKLDEPYVYESGTDTHAEFGPVVVPKGRLWVMGDHRNDSADSRFHCAAGGAQGSDGPSCDPTSSTVPVSEVIGKAVVVAWPPSHWRTLGTPKTYQHLADGVPLLSGLAITTPLLFVRRRRRRRAGRVLEPGA